MTNQFTEILSLVRVQVTKNHTKEGTRQFPAGVESELVATGSKGIPNSIILWIFLLACSRFTKATWTTQVATPELPGRGRGERNSHGQSRKIASLVLRVSIQLLIALWVEAMTLYRLKCRLGKRKRYEAVRSVGEPRVSGVSVSAGGGGVLVRGAAGEELWASVWMGKGVDEKAQEEKNAWCASRGAVSFGKPRTLICEQAFASKIVGTGLSGGPTKPRK